MKGSQIRTGAILSYIAIFLNIAISFFYTPWMIRQIGVSDYGLYCLVGSFISYFMLDLGLTQTVQRFLAKYRAEGDELALRNLLGLIIKVFLGVDGVIVLLLVILYFFLTRIFTGLSAEEIEKFKVLYCISGTFSVLTFMFKPLGGAIMAFELFAETKWIDMIHKVGTVVLVCLALFGGANVYILVLINGGAAFLTSLSKYIVFKYKTRLKINWSYFDLGKLKEVFSFSMWAFGNGLAQRMRLTLVQSLLGIFSNSAEISVFALGMTLEAMFYTISSAINGLFLPRVSTLSIQHGKNAVEQLMVRVGRLQLFLTTLLFTGFIIFGRQFILLWVGEKFLNTYYVLICLTITDMVTLTQRIADDYIYVENRIKNSSIRIIICSFIGLIISAILASRLGAVGCGIGTGTGLIIYTFLINYYYQKGLNLDIMKFFTECHIKILPVLIIVFIITWLVVHSMCLDSWIRLALAIFVYASIFAIVSYFVLFNSEEKKLVNDLVLR